ncbi:HIT family protein [Streptomyces sp. SLBN-31]|jgi:histidine triad (HIT) family protein|uniref:HIT family protein n=1 Tax=Streptomyces sp. SLBN-31 TaxID=2768444 RepID=UPI00115060E9|nr:HIT domain-containing protein [Streptomyces sp. SLBN-31]TQJ91651.1 histidine triad (HIT) family protein [Streptomyces sp. SLBN-31]
MTVDHPAEDCVFCEIAAGTAPARVVAETAQTLTFLPVHPAHAGHVLVVPRRHVADIWELDGPTAAAVGAEVLRAAHAVRAAHRPEGLNIIQSSGEVATQSVPHVHVHVVPRYLGDRMPRLWPEKGEEDQDLLDDSARRLRAAFATRQP